jgi:hypothetical protein
MMFALIFTAIGAGAVTAIGSWPFIGAGALLAAPLGASLAVAAMAVLVPRGTMSEADLGLDAITDRMVADLRGITAAMERADSVAPDLRRKAG